MIINFIFIKEKIGYETYNDGQGRCVHRNVQNDANNSDEHGPILGSMEAQHGDERDREKEHEFPEKNKQDLALINKNINNRHVTCIIEIVMLII